MLVLVPVWFRKGTAPEFQIAPELAMQLPTFGAPLQGTGTYTSLLVSIATLVPVAMYGEVVVPVSTYAGRLKTPSLTMSDRSASMAP